MRMVQRNMHTKTLKRKFDFIDNKLHSDFRLLLLRSLFCIQKQIRTPTRARTIWNRNITIFPKYCIDEWNSIEY